MHVLMMRPADTGYVGKVGKTSATHKSLNSAALGMLKIFTKTFAANLVAIEDIQTGQHENRRNPEVPGDSLVQKCPAIERAKE